MTMLDPHLDVEQLSAAVDGLADGGVEAHLESCAACRRQLDTWRIVVASLTQAAREDRLGADVTEQALAAALGAAAAGVPAAGVPAAAGVATAPAARLAPEPSGVVAIERGRRPPAERRRRLRTAAAAVIGTAAAAGLIALAVTNLPHGSSSASRISSAGALPAGVAAGPDRKSSGTGAGSVAGSPASSGASGSAVHSRAGRYRATSGASGSGGSLAAPAPGSGPSAGSAASAGGSGTASSGGPVSSAGTAPAPANPPTRSSPGPTPSGTAPGAASARPSAPPHLGPVPDSAALRSVLESRLGAAPTGPPGPSAVDTGPGGNGAVARCSDAAQQLAGTGAGYPQYVALLHYAGIPGEVYVFAVGGQWRARALDRGCHTLATVRF